MTLDQNCLESGEIAGLEIQVGMLAVGRERGDVGVRGSNRWRNRILDRGRWGIAGDGAVGEGEAGIGRRVELQDVDVVELAAVEGDAVGAAHHKLMREGCRQSRPGARSPYARSSRGEWAGARYVGVAC